MNFPRARDRKGTVINPLENACHEALKFVLSTAGPVDKTLQALFRKNPQWGARWRKTITEMVFGILRHKQWFEFLDKNSTKRGAPDVSTAVQAWLSGSWQEGFAGLNNWHDPRQHNLPAFLADLLQTETGSRFPELARSLLTQAPLDIRVQTHLATRESIEQVFMGKGLSCEKTPFSPWGLRFADHPSLHKEPVFLEGKIEVQDEGSQLIAALTQATRNAVVIDFCAGAGGKTLALANLMRNQGYLYAWDTSAHRLAQLCARAQRGGFQNIRTAVISEKQDVRVNALRQKADCVLVDVPCSGTGTLRRQPDLKWRITPNDLAHYTTTQKNILNRAAQLVKPGGRLVYATCSLLRMENEAIVTSFLETHASFKLRSAADILEKMAVAQASTLCEGAFLRLWPDVHQTDGFFAAVFDAES